MEGKLNDIFFQFRAYHSGNCVFILTQTFMNKLNCFVSSPQTFKLDSILFINPKCKVNVVTQVTVMAVDRKDFLWWTSVFPLGLGLGWVNFRGALIAPTSLILCDRRSVDTDT